MSIWAEVDTNVLNQGDLLDAVAIPDYGSDFAPPEFEIETIETRVVVLSQSCDLENKKTPFVVVAAVFTLDEFEATNPEFKGKGRWSEVARGRIEALHMLHPPNNSNDPRKFLVVSFRDVAALPFYYVEGIAKKAGKRPRLQSPYLEHLSQSFGRFFMRVALPIDLPRGF
jgi:hypothetical protein